MAVVEGVEVCAYRRHSLDGYDAICFSMFLYIS